MSRNFWSLFAFATTTLLATTAHAGGAYGYASAGVSQTSVDCAAEFQCDKSGSFLFAGGGYRFGSGISIEGFAANLGKVKGTINGSPQQVETSAIGAAATYEIPLSESFRFLARLGIARMNTGTRYLLSGAPQQGRISDNYFNPTAGVELNWVLSKTFTVGVGASFWKTTAFSNDLSIVAGGLNARLLF